LRSVDNEPVIVSNKVYIVYISISVKLLPNNYTIGLVILYDYHLNATKNLVHDGITAYGRPYIFRKLKFSNFN